MISIINEYVWDSALVNPYLDKKGIMQWADTVYHILKQQTLSRHKSLNHVFENKIRKIERKFSDTIINKWNSSQVIFNPQNLNKTDRIGYSPVVETNIVIDVMPREYATRKNIALQDSAPIWNIDFSDLQILVHEIRLEEYFNWEYLDFKCSKKNIKRRIPWLYPVDGNFEEKKVSLYFKITLFLKL